VACDLLIHTNMLLRVASVIALLPWAASGNLMTFDEGLERNLPSRMPTFTEDGITASGGIAYFGVPSAAHIDHFGTPSRALSTCSWRPARCSSRRA
jgi:hypothetical protein